MSSEANSDSIMDIVEKALQNVEIEELGNKAMEMHNNMIKKAEVEIDEMEKNIKKGHGNLVNLVKDHDECKALNQKTCLTMDKYANVLVEKKKELNDKTDKLLGMEEEKLDCQGKIEILSERLISLGLNLSEEEKEERRKELGAKEQETQQLVDELNTLKEEYRRGTSNIAILDDRRDIVSRRITRFKEKIFALSYELNNLEENLNNVEEQLKTVDSRWQSSVISVLEVIDSVLPAMKTVIDVAEQALPLQSKTIIKMVQLIFLGLEYITKFTLSITKKSYELKKSILENEKDMAEKLKKQKNTTLDAIKTSFRDNVTLLQGCNLEKKEKIKSSDETQKKILQKKTELVKLQSKCSSIEAMLSTDKVEDREKLNQEIKKAKELKNKLLFEEMNLKQEIRDAKEAEDNERSKLQKTYKSLAEAESRLSDIEQKVNIENDRKNKLEDELKLKKREHEISKLELSRFRDWSEQWKTEFKSSNKDMKIKVKELHNEFEKLKPEEKEEELKNIRNNSISSKNVNMC